MPKPVSVLKRRPQFLAVAATNRRAAAPGVVVQRRDRPPDPAATAKDRDLATLPPDAIRYGLTASRKVGNAVARNRARRRLRALAETILPDLTEGGVDLVLIARGATVTRPADQLRGDLLGCLKRLGLIDRGGHRRDRTG